jgi:hypothetical protein
MIFLNVSVDMWANPCPAEAKGQKRPNLLVEGHFLNALQNILVPQFTRHYLLPLANLSQNLGICAELADIIIFHKLKHAEAIAREVPQDWQVLAPLRHTLREALAVLADQVEHMHIAQPRGYFPQALQSFFLVQAKGRLPVAFKVGVLGFSHQPYRRRGGICQGVFMVLEGNRHAGLASQAGNPPGVFDHHTPPG